MLKTILVSVVKAAAVIVIAVVVLSAIGFVAMQVKEKYEKSEAEPYEKAKTWTVDTSKQLKMGLTVRTKLVGGEMLADVLFAGHPSYLDVPKNAGGSFAIIFNDKDGFKLFEKKIELNEFTTVTGPDGKPAGLSYDFDQLMTVDSYSKFSAATVIWYMDLNAEVESLKEPVVRATPDICAPGLSKSERLKRLAQYGEVRQTAEDIFTAGGHSVSFFSYDNSLINCR